MSGGSQGGKSQLGGAGQMNYMVNGPGSGGAFTQTAQQTPQWLQGLKLGQQFAQTGVQMAQAGQQQQAPQMPMQRPMMGGGMPGGMPQQVVPGAQPQQPMGPGMMTGGMGMPQGQQGGINPQLLQMLMRSRQ